MTESITEQGPFDPAAHGYALAAAQKTLAGETVRWMVGKEVKITSKGDIYGRVWDVDTYEGILDRVLEREYHSNLIIEAIHDGCKTPRDIQKKIGLDLKWISRLLADMEKRGLVEFCGMEERKPVFAAL